MKLVKIKRENGSYRLASKPEGASMTDQSDKNYLDINNIMENYSKTGLLPQFKEKVAQYMDASILPSYIEAHSQIREAKELFEAIPSPIRKLMDNNPANLEPFLKDPENKDILIKYGVLEKKEQKFSSPSSSGGKGAVGSGADKVSEPKGEAASQKK